MRAGDLKENLAVAMDTLRSRKLRSGLTILGIIIGVTSVICVAAIIDGLNAAGFDQEAEQIAYLNQVFGTSSDSLAELKAFNLQLISDAWDKNQNGYVCAYELRGTRAHFDDPFINLTFFGVSDDRIGKN